MRFAMALLKEEMWKVFLRWLPEGTSLEGALDSVRSGTLDPYSAVECLTEQFELFCSAKKEKNGEPKNAPLS